MVVATYPASVDIPAAQALWDIDNQKCFDLTMLAMSNCPEGQTVLSAFEYNPAILDIADPAKYADDGRGAYLQLEHNAMGGKGITTGAYFMRLLFDMKLKDVPVKERITRHNEACHRLLQCLNVTLDSLLTAHLLYILGPDPAYVVVNHECSKDGTTYSDAYNMIMACQSRLELTSDLPNDAASAFVARSKRPPMTAEQLKEVVCHECGQKGHFRSKCPKLNRANKAKGKKPGKNKKQAQSSDDDSVDSDYDAIGFKAVAVEVLPDSWFVIFVACLSVIFFALVSWYHANKSYVVETAYRVVRTVKVLWVVDSGSTKHVVNDRFMLDDFETIDASLVIGDGKALEVTGRGTMRIEAYDMSKKAHSITIKHVWYCPKLDANLFSMRCWTKVTGNSATFGDKKHGDCLLQGNTFFPMSAQGAEYVWDIMVKLHVNSALSAIADRPPASVSAMSLKPASAELWHNRLGHMAIKAIQHTAKHQCVHGLVLQNVSDLPSKVPCGACIEAGLRPTPRKEIPIAESVRSTAPLGLVHVDGITMKLPSFGCIGGYLYVDDYSRVRSFIGVKYKSQFLMSLQRFNQLYAHSSGHTLKTIVINCIQTDGASELVEGATRRWCEENQIAIQISAPGVAQENGIAEKSVHLVKKMAQTIHKSAGFPPHFWLLSINLAAHILMFSTPKLHGGSVTCYERMFGRKPDVSHLRVPGCLVYYYAYQIKKKSFFDDKANKGVLVGYCTRSRTYLIYNSVTNRVIRSAEVVFNEACLPMLAANYAVPGTSPPSADLLLPANLQWGQKDGDPVHMVTLGTTVSSKPRELLGAVPPEKVPLSHDSEIDLDLDDLLDDPDPSISSANPYQPLSQKVSRELRGLQRTPKCWLPTVRPMALTARSVPDSSVAFLAVALRAVACFAPTTMDINAVARTAVAFYGLEPETYQEAITGPDASRWREAMQDEIDAMKRLEAFEVVPTSVVPEGVRVLPSRWVFKIKPDKFKARICVRGDLQPLSQAGDTFSPTLKFVTVRLLFALAALYGFDLCQMDVCNAFVNAALVEAVYMHAPQGFSTSGFCWRLLKALYGLKGSPRAWFKHLQTYLLSIGLQAYELDPCLFVLIVDNAIALLVGIHVDDLLIVGLLERTVWFRQQMKDKFKMTDLGRPSVLLGLNISYGSEGSITLYAETYISKIAQRFNFEHCQNKKSYSTPMEPGLHLSIADEAKDEHEIGDFPYMSLVASLLYLSIAVRPDICFAVKELCRFMVRPGMAMVKAAKRVLRYVISTPKLGLKYHGTHRSILSGLWRCTNDNPIVSFSDADFAGELDGRKSTEGALIMFNGTAISWWSRTLKTVACSTQDAEYMALSDTARETIFCRNLLCLLGFELSTTPLYGDNNGSLALAANPGGEHQRSKHIDVRYHYVRQQIEEKFIAALKIGTKYQLADFTTKSMALTQFMFLVLIAMGINSGDEPDP